MPVKYIRARDRIHPDQRHILDILIAELKDLLPESTSDRPQIFIEEVPISHAVRLYAVWDKWKGIGMQDRSRLLLQAFADAKTEAEAATVTVAMGLTPAEAKRMGLDLS